MSAPEVGDRVRVIAGQWTGWEGVVRVTWGQGFMSADLTHPDYPDQWRRTLHVDEVEKVQP